MFINTELVEYHWEGSDFNFPKVQQLLHFGEQIRWDRSLKQLSIETRERSCRTQLKDPYNKSNHSGNIYGQIINYYQWRDVFAIWSFNDAATRGENAESGSDSSEGTQAAVKFTSKQSSSGQAKIIRPHNSPSWPAGPSSLLGRSRLGQGPHCPSPSWDRIWTDCQRLPGTPLA